MDFSELQQLDELININLTTYGSSPVKPQIIPSLDLTDVYEEEEIPSKLPPLHQKSMKYNLNQPSRFIKYPSLELSNSMKLMHLKKIRMEKIRSKLNERIEKDKKIRKERLPSFSKASDSINFSIEQLMSTVNTENQNKSHKVARNLYEVKIRNRVKESCMLIKKGRELEKVFAISIIHAILCDNLRSVEAHIDSTAKDFEKLRLVNSKDQFNRTALHYASCLGNEPAVSMLLKLGADPKIKDFRNRTPLHYVSFANDNKLITTLLRGLHRYKDTANRMKTNKKHYSVARLIKYKQPGQKQMPETVNDMVIKDPPTVVLDLKIFNEGIQAFFEKLNELPQNSSFIEQAARKYVDMQDNEGRTALHLAVVNQKINIVQGLIEADANIAIEDVYGKRPLELSTSKLVSEIIITKLKHSLAYKQSKNAIYKDSIDNRDLHALSQEDINMLLKNDKQSYLMTAVKNNNLEAVKILLKKNASISQANSQGWNSLMFAAQANNLDMLKIMIEGSENEEVRWKYAIKSWVDDSWRALEGVTKEGWNILHVCSVFSKIDVFVYIIDVLKTREAAQTSEDCPAIFKNITVSSLEKLLESTCRKRNTPFLLAIKHNRLDSVKLLVSHNCNIYIRNGKLQNAMHIASSKTLADILEYLIRLDADKNILRSQLDIQQRKPKDLDVSTKLDCYFLHIWDYAKLGEFIKIEEVINSGQYSVNEKTLIRKLTPLHVAVENRQLQVIRTLIGLGADTSLRTSAGMTASDIAFYTVDLQYQNTVARLLNGGKNLVENEYSERKLNTLYTKLMKGKSHSQKTLPSVMLNRNPLSLPLSDKLREFWEQIRLKLIEKQISMTDVFSMMDKKNKGTLSLLEFQSMIAWLGLPFSNDVCAEIFYESDENNNGLVEYSEVLKRIHFVANTQKESAVDYKNLPRLLVNIGNS